MTFSAVGNALLQMAGSLVSIEVEGNNRGLTCVSEENSDSPHVRRCYGWKSNIDRAECKEKTSPFGLENRK